MLLETEIYYTPTIKKRSFGEIEAKGRQKPLSPPLVSS